MPQPKPKKRAAASKALRAVPPVVVEAAPVPPPETEEAPAPVRPTPRGMTTEQIRRVGNRIAEHERDLKGNTSRRN